MILNISLPEESDLLIKEGATVDRNTPLYKGTVTEEVIVPLADILKIDSKKIFTTLKKFVGEEVKKGDIVAFHAGMFARRRYVSEHDGVIREVNHTERYLLIDSETEKSNDQYAWFSGQIEKIHTNEEGRALSLDLKVEKAETIDAREISNNFGGRLLYLKPAAIQTATEDEINGAVVVSRNFQEFEQTKLEALGANGFISAHPPKNTPSLPYAILENPDDLEKLNTEEFLYCVSDKQKGTIHLYH